MDDAVKDFVSSRTVAVVGVSNKKFGGTIYKALKKRSYTVYPVHPTRTEFDGDRCYPSLTAIPDNVERAVIAVSPESALNVVDDAVNKGTMRLWFQQGADFTEAARKAEEAGISVTTGKCILMYAEPVTGIHAFHRFLARLFGSV